MSVLVVSVYRPGTWELYRAQRWFFDATTDSYTQLIVSSEAPPFRCEFKHADQTNIAGSQRHLAGLRAALPWVKERMRSADLILFCDSDAFPVLSGWDHKLLGLMSLYGRTVAAPVRTESLELFPHVSFMAFLPKALPYISRAMRVPRQRGAVLWNRRDIDGHYRAYKVDPIAGVHLSQCFPLVKSNYLSPDPVLHSIYGNIAFHAAASSRMNGRDCSQHYWPQLIDHIPDLSIPKLPTPAWINKLLGEARFADQPLPHLEEY